MNDDVNVSFSSAVVETGEVSSTTEEILPAQLSKGAEVVTVDDDNDEEERLRQIFYASQTHQPSRIQVKLGKHLTISPGEERSLSIGLKERLTSNYLLHIHPDFQPYQTTGIQMVMELINGMSVQLDLRNSGVEPVSLTSDLHVVLLQQRTQESKSHKKSTKKMPLLVKKKVSSEGGIKKPTVPRVAEICQPERVKILKFRVILQECIQIPGKSVTYAEVRVEGGNQHVFGKVHEIVRHPDFRNSSVFIPERQKKKICREVKLHMSLRNRIEGSIKLEAGTTVGQILVRHQAGTKRSSEFTTSAKKKVRVVSPVEGGEPSTSPISELKDMSAQSSQETAVSPTAQKRDRNKEKQTSQDKEKQTGQDKENQTGQDKKKQTGQNIEKKTGQDKEKQTGLDKEKQTGQDKEKILALIKAAITEHPVVKGTDSGGREQEGHFREKSGEVACVHEGRAEACKVAMLGNRCSNASCLLSTQHSFTKKFIQARNAEFCMDYLREKVCSKSFAPFVCGSNQHVYDVSEVLRFYESHHKESVEACEYCRDRRNVSKSVIAGKECDKNVQPASESVGSSTSKVATDTNISSHDQSKTAQDIPSLTDIKQGEATDQTTGKESSSLSCVKKKIADENKLTAEASKVLLSESFRDKPDGPAKATEDDDVVEILEPEPEPGLKIKCPHIILNPNICPQIGQCTDKACRGVHIVSSLVRLQYCLEYLRKKGPCSGYCPPHYNPVQLQRAYTLALKEAVLKCSKCSFNCKLFNPENRRYRQDRICFGEYTGKCRKKEKCPFLHFQELSHLKMPPHCRTFAVKGMCPRRGLEKGVVHISHQNYQSNFLNILKENMKKCSLCTSELGRKQQEFQDTLMLPQLEVEEEKEEKKANMPLIIQNDDASKLPEKDPNSQPIDDEQVSAGGVKESCVQTAKSTDSEISRAVDDKSSCEATSSKILNTSRAISNDFEVGSSEGLDEPTTVDAACADVETIRLGLPRTDTPTSTPSPTDTGSIIGQGTYPGIANKSTRQDETTEDKNMLSKPVTIPKAEETRNPGEHAGHADKSHSNRSTPTLHNYGPRDRGTSTAAGQQYHPPRQHPFQARPPFSHAGRGSRVNQAQGSRTHNYYYQSARKRKVCPFYGTVAKCKKGSQCMDIHDLKNVVCSFYRAGYCAQGANCQRQHSF